MSTTITRTTTAAAALVLAGALAACGGEDETTIDPAPEPMPQTPSEPDESETDPMPEPDDEAPTDGNDPDQDGSPDGGSPAPGDDQQEGPDQEPPGDGTDGANAATYEDWLSVPLPADWSEYEEGVWTGNDGAAIHLRPCNAPDSGTLEYEDCVDFVPNVGPPSAEDPNTEVATEELDPDPGNLRATYVSVSDGDVELVHWIVENQHTGEVAVLAYHSEGVSDEVLESVAGMSYTG